MDKQAAKRLGASLQTLLNDGSPRTNLSMQKAVMAVYKCLSESRNSTAHFERVEYLFQLLGQTAAETGLIVGRASKESTKVAGSVEARAMVAVSIGSNGLTVSANGHVVPATTDLVVASGSGLLIVNDLNQVTEHHPFSTTGLLRSYIHLHSYVHLCLRVCLCLHLFNMYTRQAKRSTTAWISFAWNASSRKTS